MLLSVGRLVRIRSSLTTLSKCKQTVRPSTELNLSRRQICQALTSNLLLVGVCLRVYRLGFADRRELLTGNLSTLAHIESVRLFQSTDRVHPPSLTQN